MQGYGQMQQPPQAFGGIPPQSINLQLQQPTMQMQPPPVQQPYTRKPRGSRMIHIINPDTGDEVTPQVEADAIGEQQLEQVKPLV